MDRIAEIFSKKIKNKLGSHIKKIILFGSRARGDYNSETSDYDFLIIVDKKDENIKQIIFNESIELECEENELINSIVWDEKESKSYEIYPIGINIKNQGIEL